MQVLVTSMLIAQDNAALLAPLTRLGATLRFSPFPGRRAPGELAALLADADAMLAGTDPVTEDVLAQTSRLKLIARVGVGYDAIDIEAARRHGVVVSVTPSANEITVADYALAAMLALLRHVVHSHVTTQAGKWDRRGGTDLAGKTIGIIGLGRIGKLVARRLAGFDTRLLAYDLYQDAAFAAQYGVTYMDLDALLAEADVVTLHLLLNPSTRHLLDASRLARMKRGAFLVNTCRGPVVDEHALAAALAAGQLGGAALDVFEEEPPSDSPILQAPNVLLSPHIAGISAESSQRMAEMAIAEVARVLQGQAPLHPVPASLSAASW